MADTLKSLSLYIHIPFCVKKCRYCDFYSIPFDMDEAGRFIEALAKEWEFVKKEIGLDRTEVETIFFGGGTPSMLPVKLWDRLDSLLMKNMNRSAGYEWTIECNPDSFTEEKALLWHSMGVTRLTFGVQSLDDRELEFLGRPHSAAQALAALESPVLSRFKSIGADLMYGLPGQTVSSFEKSIHTVLSNPVISHLSAYELTINPHTQLGRHVSKIPFPSEETVLAMAKALFSRCKDHGLERYEISNFSKPGHRCKHNETYWNHSAYIGLGPAAHSYINEKRFANTGSVSRYISDLSRGTRPLEFTEDLTPDNLVSEMIFLRLRTADGLDENDFMERTGQTFYSGARTAVLDELTKGNMIARKHPWWRLTEQGMFVADAIAKKLV